MNSEMPFMLRIGLLGAGLALAAPAGAAVLMPSSTTDATVCRDTSSAADGGGTVTGATSTSAVIGNSTNTANRVEVGVFVFQLPSLGAIANPFTEETLNLRLVFANNMFSFNGSNGYDLYGLGARASSSVLGDDFYVGSANDTTDATKLVDKFISRAVVGDNNVPSGGIGFQLTGTALVNYLNTQYAAGANAGKYIFFRVNPDFIPPTFGRGNIGTAERTTDFPTLTYTAIPEPGTLALAAAGLGLIALRRRRV